MTARETALRAAVLKALADLVRDEYDTARAELDGALRELADSIGATSLHVSLPDGRDIATVSLVGGKPTAHVVDERAFLAWVQDAHPTEIERRVREPYRRALLDGITKRGAACDPDSGEVVPGVEFTVGSRFVSTRFTPGGRAAVAEAWRAGSLSGITGPAPELPAGESDE